MLRELIAQMAGFLNGLESLEVAAQVEGLESILANAGISACADVLAGCLMSIMLDFPDADVAPS